MFPQCVHTWGLHGTGSGLVGSKVGAYVFALFGDLCSVKVPQSSFFAGNLTRNGSRIGAADLAFWHIFGGLECVAGKGRKTSGTFSFTWHARYLVNLDDGLFQCGTWSSF